MPPCFHLAEQHRVAGHIARARATAAAATVDQLDPIRRVSRALLLELLAAYQAERQFPSNSDFDAQTPFLIDASGRRCAMAALLEAGGESALVARLARERNNARIRELADEPRLQAWLEAAGLTVAEAAAIQPSYCFETNSSCLCGWGAFSHPSTGLLEGELISTDGPQIARVLVTHDKVGDFQVGDLFTTENAASVGRVLAPVDTPVVGLRGADGGLVTTDGGLFFFGSVTLAADGSINCSGAATHTPTLTADQVAQAAEAPSCTQALTSIDSAWSDSICGAGCGCRAAAGPTPLGVLVALVGAVAVVRARRRRRG